MPVDKTDTPNPAQQPLPIRAYNAITSARGVINRMVEAENSGNYVAAEHYAMELLNAAELAASYYRQFTRPVTVTRLPVPIGAYMGRWDPKDGTNSILPPSNCKPGSYFEAASDDGEFRTGDLLVAVGVSWYRLPAEVVAATLEG